jgi:hypothetical protein
MDQWRTSSDFSAAEINLQARNDDGMGAGSIWFCLEGVKKAKTMA